MIVELGKNGFVSSFNQLYRLTTTTTTTTTTKRPQAIYKTTLVVYVFLHLSSC